MSQIITDKEIYTSFFNNSIEISAGSSYFIKVDPLTFSFTETCSSPKIIPFSNRTFHAIAKTPIWLHHDLFRQFKTLENTEPYEDLLINAQKQKTDELAFCIAHAPLGNVPSPEILQENVDTLYQIDSMIQYAEIVDYDEQNGNYFSTIRYTNLINNTIVKDEIPKEIYYSYVVYPKISGEVVEPIYNTFWRSFIYNHNDQGYPLLRELISNISYYWNLQSYTQPTKRIWSEWIALHPTAIETISYWVGKTIPNLAIGDRPIQPNHIAHQHNGYCGELQTLAVAAQRTLLIPSICVNNIGEDHVWRAFYNQGWHQNDNWWADGGGCVDIPFIYTDGWGKDMSAVYAEKGDGVIFDMTKDYLHPKDVITVNFTVVDGFLRPYDNARITVLVKGLKDISWYQYKILEIMEQIWNTYADTFNNTFIENWYNRLSDRIIHLPEVIDSALITTWNYTNIDGTCSFSLGKHDDYIFLIQSPSIDLPWPLAKYSSLRFIKDHKDKDFFVYLQDFSRKPIAYETIPNEGKYSVDVNYNSTWMHYHKNIKTKDIGIYCYHDDFEIFILDETNFNRYQQHLPFSTLKNNNKLGESSQISIDSPVYIIFNNYAKHATLIVDINIQLTGQIFEDFICIEAPQSGIFPYPIYNIGDTIDIKGSASNAWDLSIANDTITYSKGQWNYVWNTTYYQPGIYSIRGSCGENKVTKKIQLIDVNPPEIIIDSPDPDQLFYQSDNMTCSGVINDKSSISSINITIDNMLLNHSIQRNKWEVLLDLSSLSPGLHTITITVIDVANNKQEKTIPFVILDDSNHNPPEIYEYRTYHNSIGNWTRLTLIAHALSSSMYPIKELRAYILHDDHLKEKVMYEYASFPVLDRHPEDSLFNQSNKPSYGCFLGDFHKGDSISYWIEVTDFSGASSKTPIENIEI